MGPDETSNQFLARGTAEYYEQMGDSAVWLQKGIQWGSNEIKAGLGKIRKFKDGALELGSAGLEKTWEIGSSVWKSMRDGISLCAGNNTALRRLGSTSSTVSLHVWFYTSIPGIL